MSMAASYSGPNAGGWAKRSSAEHTHTHTPPEAVGIRVLEMQELRPAFICAGGEFLILIYVAKY